MLIVLDLETTGLNPDRCEILEVAAIAVDDKLEEVARFEEYVVPNRELWDMDEFVRDMHTKNGLLAQLRESKFTTSSEWLKGNHSASAVDAKLAAFIRQHGVKLGKATDKDGREVVTLDRPQLCGNTIGFDKSFLRVHMPEAYAELHYRSLDVSSLNEVAKRFWPNVYEATKQVKPDGEGKEHRAMWDAMRSLLQLRKYTELLSPAAIVANVGDAAFDDERVAARKMAERSRRSWEAPLGGRTKDQVIERDLADERLQKLLEDGNIRLPDDNPAAAWRSMILDAVLGIAR